ncbi:winged helix-turn-helix domain-containing protein [Treponema sp. OMZ 840]|uniref:hypothetical protein n=1 Tax=Treponema sp. OMZ 840 TaxID=244313 RepID=UPI003D8B7CA7
MVKRLISRAKVLEEPQVLYFLLLCKKNGLKGLLRYALSYENCTCKTVWNLSALFKEIRCKVPDCIILDRDFFIFADKNTQIEPYIRASIFFDKFDFMIFLYDAQNIHKLSIPVFQNKQCSCETKKKIETILKNAANKIELLKNPPEEFRPAEKKLYSLLKRKAEQALSLEEMSFALWGIHTDAHTKTLYTYIHRINCILQQAAHRPESLIKVKKGYYKLTFESL